MFVLSRSGSLKSTENEVRNALSRKRGNAVKTRVLVLLVCLMVVLSAGSLLFLTLRSQDREPSGATIVWSEEVPNGTGR